MRLAETSLSSILVSLACGCTSATFDTAPPSTIDSDVPPGDGATTDTAVDPCAKVDGVAKFCINVAPVNTHPGYGSDTGADVLAIDGNGVLKVYLYNEDPGDPTRKTAIKPIVTIAGPSLNIDTGLSVSIPSSAPPGDYWFTVVFEDNPAADRTTSFAVPGDFVFVPNIVDQKAVYPKVTLVNGETQAIPVSIRPMRQVDASVQATPALRAKALADTTASVHGDGPIAFLLYDGSLATTSSATFVDLSYQRCIDLDIRGLDPTIPVSFGTVVDGKHNLLAVLFDYDYPAATKDFPGAGSIISPITDTTIDKIETVDVGTTRWLTSVNVRMADVPIPASGLDKQVCKGAM